MPEQSISELIEQSVGLPMDECLVMMRSGAKVRILGIDQYGASYPVIGFDSNNNNRSYAWKLSGAFNAFRGPSPYDLIPAPKRESKWRAWYGEGSFGFHNHENSVRSAHPSADAYERIDFVDGKPVDSDWFQNGGAK